MPDSPIEVGCEHNLHRLIEYPGGEEPMSFGDRLILKCLFGCKDIIVLVGKERLVETSKKGVVC